MEEQLRISEKMASLGLLAAGVFAFTFAALVGQMLVQKKS